MNIFLYLIFFIFCFVSHLAHAEDWPALYESNDFLARKASEKKDFDKLNRSKLQRMKNEDVRNKIYDTFYFIEDFMSDSKGEQPKNWIDSKKDPNLALLFGSASNIKRVDPHLRFPIYTLPTISYFQGGDENTSRLNRCIYYWHIENFQEAYDCFLRFQNDVSKNRAVISDLFKAQLFLTQAFFLLAVAPSNIVIYGVPPPDPKLPTPEIKHSDIFQFARMILTDISLSMSVDLYKPKKNTQVISDIFKNIFSSSYFVKAFQYEKGTILPTKLYPYSVDPKTWFYTVLPLAFVNTIFLNEKESDWTKSFSAALRLDNLIKELILVDQPQGNAIPWIPAQPKVNSDIYLQPRNMTDMLTTIDVLKILIYKKGENLTAGMSLAAEGILRKGDPDLSALLFTLIGNSYFDFNILRLARRNYSWSELVSQNFVDKVPSSIFFGAESAFWLGDYDTAKHGFTRFLNHTSDKDFSPWAKLRLAEIEQQNGYIKHAQTLYEHLIHTYEKHPSAQDAQVRLFCSYVDELNPKVRQIEADKVLKKIVDARSDLKKQAKACLLKSDLKKSTENSYLKSSNKEVLKIAKEQINLVENYKKEFPDSYFLSLFSGRVEELKLANINDLSDKSDCPRLIQFYKENAKNLKKLSLKNHSYVKGLKWSRSERVKVLRCAALNEDLSLWKALRNTDAKTDGAKIQTHLFYFQIRPSLSSALDLYHDLSPQVDAWKEMLHKIESSSFTMTDELDYWRWLSLRTFLIYSLSLGSEKKDLLEKSIFLSLLNQSDKIFKTSYNCRLVLEILQKLSAKNLDDIAQIATSIDWLNWLNQNLNTEVKKNNLEKCQILLAHNLFVISISNPSKIRDKVIVRAYLEKQGIEKIPEEWLSYVQRLERMKETQISELRSIYTNLSRQTQNVSIQKSALLWLQQHSTQDQVGALW